MGTGPMGRAPRAATMVSATRQPRSRLASIMLLSHHTGAQRRRQPRLPSPSPAPLRISWGVDREGVEGTVDVTKQQHLHTWHVLSDCVNYPKPHSH